LSTSLGVGLCVGTPAKRPGKGVKGQLRAQNDFRAASQLARTFHPLDEELDRLVTNAQLAPMKS